jgi:hypothetical protein
VAAADVLRSSGRGRRRRALVAAVVVAGTLTTAGTVGAAGGQCRSVESAPGGWTAAALPATPSLPVMGVTPIVVTSVVGQDPSVALATDGMAVFRTADGGCNWQTVFTLGATDYYSDGDLLTGYSVTNIANGHSAGAGDHQDVYLALSPNPLNVLTMATLFGAALPEFFAASHDGGKTFALVPPQPGAANPLVPECLATPGYFVVSPADGKTIYLRCAGGLAQSVAEAAVSGGASSMFGSADGGLSWSLIGLPAAVSMASPQWMAPGPAKNELWMGGYSGTSTLTVWHSRDSGHTWTAQTLDPKPVPSSTTSTPVGVVIDNAPGSAALRLAVYAAGGTYASNDLGKHWQQLRAVTFADGTRPAVGAFFLRHSLHVMFAGQISCKGQPVLARYRQLSARPVTVLFPSKWGSYASWGGDATFAVVGHGVVANGLARFCAPGSSVTSSARLLNWRVG